MKRRPGPALAAVACATIVVTFALERAIVTALGAGGTDPLVVVEPQLVRLGPAAFALTALALVQCAALVVVARAHAVRASLLTFVALAGVALTQHTAFSSDPYVYVGCAKLPAFRDAYAPPNVDMPAGFDAVYRYWGRPLFPCLYGPLWIALDRLVVAPAPTLADSFERLRVLDVVAWLALIAIVGAHGRTRRFLPLVAANPAIATLYAADMHTDLGGIALLVLAAVHAPRRVALAAALAILAGMWKIAFLPLVLCVPAPRPRARAALFVAASVILALGLSLLVAGRAYAVALLSVGHDQTRTGFVGIGHALLVLAALAALVAAFVGRAPRWTAWLPMTLGARLLPWYGVWALPLALRTRATRWFLIAWPLVAVTVGTFATAYGYVVLAALGVTLAVVDARRRQTAR